MARGKGSGSGGVRIEFQRKGDKFVGLIRVNATGMLTDTCGHDSEGHPGPGIAINCATRLAEKRGHIIVEND